MSSRSRMSMRCDVKRNRTATSDAWGQPAAESMTIHIENLPCFAYVKTKYVASDDAKTALIEDLRMLIPLGTDVTEEDDVYDIRDRLGASIYTGTFSVEAVEYHHDHLELVLNRKQGRGQQVE